MMGEARLLTYGITLGAGLMYLLDPRQGGARRALVRDKSLRALHDVEEAADVGTRDMAHRLEGAVARVRGTHRDDVSDDVVVARVRARLGHVCSHPHAVEVKAKGDGCIELKGPILAHEAREVLRAVSRVRGVETIDDDLERHSHPGDVAALQGGPAKRPAIARMWTPATRLMMGAAAGVAAIGSLINGNPLGLVLGGGTMLALARSSTRGDPQGLLRRRESRNELAPAGASREVQEGHARIATSQTTGT